MGKYKRHSPEYMTYLNAKAATEQYKKEIRREQARENRKRLFLGSIIAIIIGVLIGYVDGCPARTAQSKPVNKETVISDKTVEISKTTNVELVNEAAEPENEAVEPIKEAEQAIGSWHDSTKSHDITVNTMLNYDNKVICNFNDTVAVGVDGDTGVMTTTESKTGFILSVIDDDSVKVTFYNNGTDYAKPVKLSAELSTSNFVDDSGKTEYIISGYSTCSNGFGVVEMSLSNGWAIQAGILKEDGHLYATNLCKPEKAQNIVDFRLQMDSILAANGMTPDNCRYTDPIYYPIVPVNANECTDTAYWVNKSNEIVESEWTDAHKVKVFYDYILDNMAYDYWVVEKGAHSRTFYKKDYTGTYFTSVTNVGVCEDFANIVAIMCRAQGIPAVKAYVDSHAWSYIYIEDYGRWISVDPTRDIVYGCYSEDTSKWTEVKKVSRYTSLDNIGAENVYRDDLGATIGNEKDMEKFGKSPVLP